MDGYQAFTFAIIVAVLPLFLIVFGAAIFLMCPVLVPLWIVARVARLRRRA